MIPEKLQEIFKHEGVVAIATQGQNEPHLVNTWNSYIQITPENSLLIPAGYMNETEENIKRNNHVQMTAGTREVEGMHGPGTGFLIKGTAVFHNTGPHFEGIKQQFPWSRAALEVKVDSATQTL